MTDKPRNLPDCRYGITCKVTVGRIDLYVTVNFCDETLTPREIFAVVGKEGSTLAGLIDALTTTISVALGYGVPWEILRDKYIGHVFEPKCDTYTSIVHALASGIDRAIEAKTKLAS